MGGKMPAAGGQCERSTTGIAACRRQFDVGAGVEQHPDDRQAAPAGDGVVQTAVVVDVDATAEEPPQAGRILEVQLVDDQPFEARLVEQVKKRSATLDKGPGEGEIATFDPRGQRGHPTLAIPFDRVKAVEGSGP